MSGKAESTIVLRNNNILYKLFFVEMSNYYSTLISSPNNREIMSNFSEAMFIYLREVTSNQSITVLKNILSSDFFTKLKNSNSEYSKMINDPHLPNVIQKLDKLYHNDPDFVSKLVTKQGTTGTLNVRFEIKIFYNDAYSWS